MKEYNHHLIPMAFFLCMVVFTIGCGTKDLEPIGGYLPGQNPTDSDSILSTDTLPPSTASDSASATESSQSTDTPSEYTDTSTGTASEPTSTEDTEVESDTPTLTDTATPYDSETDTETEISTKWVGCAVTGTDYPQNFFDLWNQVTPENAGKWGEIEFERDVMNWNAHDAVYAWAVDHQAVYKAHTLVWDKQQPPWMENLPRREQADEVEEWITEFCTRYPDIELINVIMNPYHNPPSYSDALGGAGATNYDWVIRTFEMAREHCPEAQLLIEEYNALVHQTHLTAEVVAVLHERDLIDGIGCTGHGLENIGLNGLTVNINTLAEFGLPLYVGGLDIENADDDIQLDELRRLFSTMYEHPAIRGITFWGYIQGRIWSDDAYLLRANGTPRPALAWLTEYLKEVGAR
jgi:endo-1,4-beta-xylanase